MNHSTARAVQSAVQFLFHSLLVLGFFTIPSMLEAVIFGSVA
ncbi:hypothetical protein AB0O38_16105 [Pseudarthrobacter oxydans]